MTSLQRRRAHFIGSTFAPSQPKHPLALPLSITEAYRWWELIETNFPFMEYTQDTAPSRRSILNAFDKIAADGKSGDVFFLSYSGHGASVPISDVPANQRGSGGVATMVSSSSSKNAEALVPDWATQVTDFVMDAEIRQRLERIAEGVTLITCMDCCHSGTVMNLRYFVDLDESSGAPRLRTFTTVPELRANVICLSAAHDDELTFDNPISESAVFGSALRTFLSPAVSLKKAASSSSSSSSGDVTPVGTYRELLTFVDATVRSSVSKINSVYPYSLNPRKVPHISISFSRRPNTNNKNLNATSMDMLLDQVVALLPHWNGVHAMKLVQKCTTDDGVYKYFHTTQYSDGRPPAIKYNTLGICVPPSTRTSKPHSIKFLGIVAPYVLRAAIIDPWYSPIYYDTGVSTTDKGALVQMPMSGHQDIIPPTNADWVKMMPKEASWIKARQNLLKNTGSSFYSDLMSWNMPTNAIAILFDDVGALDAQNLEDDQNPAATFRKLYLYNNSGQTKKSVSRIDMLRYGLVNGFEAIQIGAGWVATLRGTDDNARVDIFRSMGALTSNVGFKVVSVTLTRSTS